MKVLGFMALMSVLIIGTATAADSISEERETFDKACIEKGLQAEIESTKLCGNMNFAIDCFSFDHDDCMIKQSGNPPTGLAYFAGIILSLIGGVCFSLMWWRDRELTHKENMKAFS